MAPAPCETCGGEGWVWLNADRKVIPRRRDGGKGKQKTIREHLRAPCRCSAGSSWLARRMNEPRPTHPGEK